MRQMLIDQARAKAAHKRGAGERPVSLDDPTAHHAVDLRMNPDELLGLNIALSGLERDETEAADIVKLRTFASMDCEEIAALLGSSKRTVDLPPRISPVPVKVQQVLPAVDNRPTESFFPSPAPLFHYSDYLIFARQTSRGDQTPVELFLRFCAEIGGTAVSRAMTSL